MRRARARRVAGVMNKAELAYSLDLEAERIAGRIQSWRFEAVTLKLADDCSYTPDFMVVMADWTIDFREVKGFWRDDAKVKIRVAAEKFPMFRFLALRPIKGNWVIEHYGMPDAA